MSKENTFYPLNIAVMTVSDSRTEETDKSGQMLVDFLTEAGHHLVEKAIVPDDLYKIREIVSRWIADPKVEVILSTGGTGVTGRDNTPEAIGPLLDKHIEGFGELFRALSFQEIKTSAIQSRAIAGVANKTYLFCLPGSTGACKTGWNQILVHQLDRRHHPCNFAELIPRLGEV
ncbi:molybdenum cofactor biosynthesis protein B [Deltaproteobacteria bacterium TL4]